MYILRNHCATGFQMGRLECIFSLLLLLLLILATPTHRQEDDVESVSSGEEQQGVGLGEEGDVNTHVADGNSGHAPDGSLGGTVDDNHDVKATSKQADIITSEYHAETTNGDPAADSDGDKDDESVPDTSNATKTPSTTTKGTGTRRDNDKVGGRFAYIVPPLIVSLFGLTLLGRSDKLGRQTVCEYKCKRSLPTPYWVLNDNTRWCYSLDGVLKDQYSFFFLIVLFFITLYIRYKYWYLPKRKVIQIIQWIGVQISQWSGHFLDCFHNQPPTTA